MSLYAALEKRYSPPVWALFYEVRNAAGHKADRSMDAFAMSTWNSRGLELHGHEVKLHRSDWLRELKDPAKAESFTPYCDYWWLVTGTDDVAHVGELPPDWGLLTRNGKALRVVKPATKNPSPKPIDRGFLAAILRRAVEMVHGAAAKRALDKRERAKVEEQVRSEFEGRISYAESEYARLTGRVQEFEKASGLDIDTYASGRIGEAVNVLLRSGALDGHRTLLDEEAKRLEDLASRARSSVEELDAAVASMRARRAQETTP